MNERTLYRDLVAWLRAHHPRVLAQWESEQRRVGDRKAGEKLLPKASSDRSQSPLNQISSGSSSAEIIRAMRLELELLGIDGGTPGATPDGTPCIHLMKSGVYGSAYEESVTLARLRDAGYRRHLKQVFG